MTFVPREEFEALKERVRILEDRLNTRRMTGPPVFPPDYRVASPNIPIPKDNTRSIEEILDMLRELREVWRHWDEDHPLP